MLTIAGPGSRFCDGMSRRSCLRIGGLALGGLALPEVLRAEAISGRNSAAGQVSNASASQGVSRSGRRAAKGVIMVLLPGGPTHLDTFDLKPDARLLSLAVRTDAQGGL
jgi:hypothetical protein